MYAATASLPGNTGFAPNKVSTSQWSQFADEEMLLRCQRGDQGALDDLLKRFERPIFALAYRLSGNYDDTHDIAATAFLRICQTIHKCKSAITLPAWVNRIVTNVFYDMCRRNRRRQASSLDEMIERTDESALPFTDGQDKSPLMYVMDGERKSVLVQAIASLPEAQRTLITMFYQEERSYEEIAAITNVPVGTIKSRLNRARTTLQRKLQPHYAALTN
jgi:RNA polymerase sigma-70 factor (ECF subfamily)